MNRAAPQPAPRLPLAAHLPAHWLPLLGMAIGALGGAVYWLGAQLWPSSVALMLALLATALLDRELDFRGGSAGARAAVLAVFALLLRYNALMALTSAKLGFVLPANLVIGLIWVAAHAASYGLAASVTATRGGAVLTALLLGVCPAVLLGLPGLIGLAAALAVRLAAARLPPAARTCTVLRQLTEIAFLLGALAGWRYV